MAVAIDVSGTFGPQVTADVSAGVVIAPFADYSDLEGESKRINIGFGIGGVTISIPENPLNFSISIDVLPGIDFGISYGSGITMIFGEDKDTSCQ